MYHYDRNVVAAVYRTAHPDELDASEQTLVDLDGDLFEEYDAEIMKQAPGAGIPTDLFSRSWLVFYAAQSTARRVSTRVRHACDFYDSVRPGPTVIVDGSTIMVAPVTEVPA